MSRYTVRIQLSDATWEEYSELHDGMEAEGFSRTITALSGNTYQLPDAEYSFVSSTLTTQEVLDLTHTIASAVKQEPKVLVTKSAERKWKGLDRV